MGAAARRTVESDYDVNAAAEQLEGDFPVPADRGGSIMNRRTARPSGSTPRWTPIGMGRRLSAALRTGRRPCHVLDAKYEPGIRASVLYQHGLRSRPR